MYSYEKWKWLVDEECYIPAIARQHVQEEKSGEAKALLLQVMLAREFLAL